MHCMCLLVKQSAAKQRNRMGLVTRATVAPGACPDLAAGHDMCA